MISRFGVPLTSEAKDVLRPVCVALGAIGVLVVLIATKGWQPMTLLLTGAAVFIAGVLVWQVRWAVGHLRSQSETVRKAAVQAERHYVDCLLRVVRFVEGRDKFAAGRSQRIGELTARLARKLGLPNDRCELMRLAGELHDIGLMAVPQSILNKPAALGKDEVQTVRQHANVSYQMLQPLECLRPVLPAVRHHHEKMNGTGYPDAIAADKIAIEARILAVADAYDAMTHDRPFRPAMTPIDAMDELKRCTPDGFDEACVAALSELMNLQDLRQAMPRKTTASA